MESTALRSAKHPLTSNYLVISVPYLQGGDKNK